MISNIILLDIYVSYEIKSLLKINSEQDCLEEC
jgi:hypothetical protein